MVEEKEVVKGVKDFSDVFKKGEELHPGVDHVDNSQLVGKDILIHKVNFLPSQFGGDFAVVLLDCEGKHLTTSIGSKVVVEQLRKVEKEFDSHVLKAKLVKKAGREGREY